MLSRSTQHLIGRILMRWSDLIGRGSAVVVHAVAARWLHKRLIPIGQLGGRPAKISQSEHPRNSNDSFVFVFVFYLE